MRFAPVLRLLERVRVDRNDLRGSVAERDEQIDTLKAELSVAKCREKRWRRAAFELAPAAGPRAMTVLLYQAQSDDLADEPEIADGDRNAFPRSLP